MASIFRETITTKSPRSLVLVQGQGGHTGKRPYWRLSLHRKPLNMCPNLLHLFLSLPCSLNPSSPLPLILLYFLFLSLSASFPFAASVCLPLSFFVVVHSAFILPSPPPLSSSSASLSIHPAERHPSSLGRHMCCFDRKGSDGVRGRKAATP